MDTIRTKRMRSILRITALFALLAFVFQQSSLITFAKERDDSKENDTELLSEESFPVILPVKNISEQGHLYRIDDDTELDTVRIFNTDETISVYKFAENVKYIDETGKISLTRYCLTVVRQ